MPEPGEDARAYRLGLATAWGVTHDGDRGRRGQPHRVEDLSRPIHAPIVDHHEMDARVRRKELNEDLRPEARHLVVAGNDQGQLWSRHGALGARHSSARSACCARTRSHSPRST